MWYELRGPGLSPRVRGHRPDRWSIDVQLRTIPAGAGTPRFNCGSDFTERDYPRGCGDTLDSQILYDLRKGLSPRVRGHPERLELQPLRPGTIPAGAGTPLTEDSLISSFRDYPRGCGDTEWPQVRRYRLSGLSPRVRGHPERAVLPRGRSGTIPAGAGTPSA